MFRHVPYRRDSALRALDRWLARRWVQALLFVTVFLLAMACSAKTAHARTQGDHCVVRVK